MTPRLIAILVVALFVGCADNAPKSDKRMPLVAPPSAGGPDRATRQAPIHHAPGSPLAELGWTRSRCMLCQKSRAAKETLLFSDRHGFGFCAECGACANAYHLASQGIRQGTGSDPQLDRMARAYANAVGERYPLCWSAFLMWGDEEQWQETWANMAGLYVRSKQAGGSEPIPDWALPKEGAGLDPVVPKLTAIPDWALPEKK